VRKVKQRIIKLEKEVKDLMNPLVKIRKDLKPILEIKKIADYRNLHDDGSGKFFSGDKKEEIEKYCEEMKAIIIKLADKYKEV